jgi:hypothetical protein
MKAVITRLLENNPPKVEISCSAGAARALWKGRRAPQLGFTYDVELDLDVILKAGQTYHRVDNGVPGLSEEGDDVLLTGVIESIDEDGMVFFRLNESCLIMVESDAADTDKGHWIQIRAPEGTLAVTPQ